MECDNQDPILCPRKVKRFKKEEMRDVSSVDLPEDCLISIFRYLDFKELCRIGRVCKAWYDVSRSSLFWKRIVINQVSQNPSLLPRLTLNLVEILPSCVVYMEINFEQILDLWALNFVDLLKKLQDRCPRLETLVLRYAGLISDFDFFKQIPQNIRVFVLHNSTIAPTYRTNQSVVSFKPVVSDLPKIEVLDICCCFEPIISKDFFSQLRYLKKLRLHGCGFYDSLLASYLLPVLGNIELLDLEDTMIGHSTFFNIWTHCTHLTELYLCNTPINSNDISEINAETVLNRLKIICLRNCNVTVECVALLIGKCPSLEKIFLEMNKKPASVDFKYDSITSNKVHLLYGVKCCDHYKKINYMYE